MYAYSYVQIWHAVILFIHFVVFIVYLYTESNVSAQRNAFLPNNIPIYGIVSAVGT